MSADCHEEHDVIKAKIETVARDLEWHSAEQHAEVMPRREINEVVGRNAYNIDLILDELLGPHHALSGERLHHKGMSHKVEKLSEEAANGGINAKLKPSQKAAIVIAGIGGAAQIITSLAAAWS